MVTFLTLLEVAVVMVDEIRRLVDENLSSESELTNVDETPWAKWAKTLSQRG